MIAKTYTVVDLFAGAGGLSLGFHQTGRFIIKVAYEINPYAQETYRRNNPDAEVYADVCNIDYDDLKNRFGQIDVVIGGPPCQGFSNANRQKNHAINKNNMLVKQFVKAVLKLNPNAFVMENVSMLKSDIHRFYVDDRDEQIIQRYGIPTKPAEILLIKQDYSFDGILDIIRRQNLVQKYIWNDSEYLAVNVIYRMRNNIPKMKATLIKHKRQILKLSARLLKERPDNYILAQNHVVADIFVRYFNGEDVEKEIIAEIEKAVMIQRMLGKVKELYECNIVIEHFSDNGDVIAHGKSMAVFDYIKYILGCEAHGYAINSGVICAADFGVPQKRKRFVILGVKKCISEKAELPKGHLKQENYFTVKDAIDDIKDIAVNYNVKEDIGIPLTGVPNGISELGKQLRDSSILFNHIVPNSTETVLKRFRNLDQGENFHDLDSSLKSTYSNVDRTQKTIYMRLNYNEPSGTVVNVRKSMWIHPSHNRAVSIREAARLQTFPDSFVFKGTKDSQYQQVGNAVPPILAKGIAFKIAEILDEQWLNKRDKHSPQVRSYNMSQIRSKNTKPEDMVSKYLHSNGFRFRKHVKDLPGCPDIVLPKYKVVIFVNGCFWHMHMDCGGFSWPSANAEYWHNKITGNAERDQKNYTALKSMGWNVIVIWECELKESIAQDRLSKLALQIRGIM